MLKNKSLLLFILGVVFLMLTSCGKNQVAVPTNIEVDIENTLSWDKCDEAKQYMLYIYDVAKNTTKEIATRKLNYSLDNLEEGDYEINLQSISGVSGKKDSKKSDTLYFHKYYETGCVYTLINNGLEYEVTKVGKAKGTFTIEDVYRGRAVTRIADQAFKNSSKVENIIIGKNVMEIGERAFYNCSKLVSCVLPENVSTLGASAFSSCRSLEKISIPGTISVIPENAFTYCRELKEVKIANGVEDISDYAFQDCSNLSEIILPTTVKTIGKYAFANNPSLKTINFPDSLESIGSYAFYQCSSIEQVDLSNALKITTIKQQAFDGCSALAKVVLPKKIETLESGAFYRCLALEEVELPKTLTTLGQACFAETAFYKAQVASGERFIYCDDWLLYYYERAEDVIVDITPAVFKENVRGIAEGAFKNNQNIKSFRAPNTLKYIGRYAFYGNINLWKINIPDDSVEVIDYGAFRNCAIYNIILGEGLKEIGTFAFADNVLLDNNKTNTQWIPGTVTRVGQYAFYNTALWNNAADTGNIVYAANWVVGYLENFRGTAELQIDTTIPAGIADYAFANCSKLTSFKGLNNVQYIGFGAFYKCSNLASVSLDRRLKEIKGYTFYGCSSLFDISMPVSVKSIGAYAFYRCNRLESIDLSETRVDTLGQGAFYACENLQNLTLNDDISVIEPYTFYGCINLTTLTLPESVTRVEKTAFYGCEKLATIQFNDKLEYIAEYAFGKCPVTEVILPDTTTYIGKLAFYKCTEIVKLDLGNEVKAIGDYAFFDCKNIEELVLPKSLVIIGNYAFKGLEKVKTIVLKDNIEYIGQHAFYGCDNATFYTNSDLIKARWHNRFNSSNRPLFLGVSFDEADRIESIKFDKEHAINVLAKGEIYVPSIDNSIFEGFSDGEKTYTLQDLKTLDKEGKLVAKYK